MIGQIRGTLLEKQPPYLMIDVNGVGYEIDAPMTTFYHLPDIGQAVTLFTHFVVREDVQQLYGFSTQKERSLFRILLKVNGIGPRSALTVLSSMESDELIRHISQNDATSLTRIPGIGKKTAERLIIEVKDKLKNWEGVPATSIAIEPGRNQVLQDAIAALVALGYKPQEASRVISKVDNDSSNSEELIRNALREMV